MKISVGISKAGKEISISDAVRGTIDYAAQDDGSLERLQSRADKTAEILGQLIQVLHETGKLGDSAVSDMLGYLYTVEE